MARGARCLSIVSCLASLGALSLAAAPAFAEEVHVISGSFGGGPTGLNHPRGIAVDNSSGPSNGDVYVADTSDNRVVKYDAAGNFLWEVGENVNEGTGDPDLCTDAGPPTDICKKEGDFTGAQNGFSNVFSIAVDSSSGPSAGDIYPSSLGVSIQKFDPSGHLVTSWGGVPYPGGINGSTAPGGPFGGGYQPDAVNSSGNLQVLTGGRLFTFAQDGTSPSSIATSKQTSNEALAVDAAGNFFQVNEIDGTIEKIGPTGTDLGQISIPAPAEFLRNPGLAFDPVHDDLYAVASTYKEGVGSAASVNRYHFNGSGEVVEPDSSTCAPTLSTGCEPTETFGSEDLSTGESPQAVAVNSATGTVYVANTGDNNVKVFKSFDAAKISGVGTTNLGRDSVKFIGHVDPDGAGEINGCEFEYGTTTEYKSGSAPCSPATTITATDVSAQLPPETLASATTYHYRLVVGNANGERPGPDQTFTTLPAVAGVTTGKPVNVGRLDASVEGSFTGDGVDTSSYFEYGPTTAYGQRTPDVDLGTASGVQSVAATLTQLTPYTTYHYRLVAHNKYGITPGADQTLFTPAPDLPTVERTYTSAVNQDSATVNAEVNPGEGLTVYRFEYGLTTSYGSRTLVGGLLNPETPDRIASAELTELLPGTTYHFRVLATNFTGTATGPDQTFTTPSVPVIISASASAIAGTSATLNAVVNPGLNPTTYHFEYGPSSAYGSRTAESAPIGDDTAAHAVNAPIAGLAPGTAYHFRLVASNGVGVTVGPDQTFTTLNPPSGNGGGGTAKPCRKGFVKKHGKCVPKPKSHKKHRTKKHKHG